MAVSLIYKYIGISVVAHDLYFHLLHFLIFTVFSSYGYARALIGILARSFKKHEKLADTVGNA